MSDAHDDYADQVRTHREEKDRFFREHEQSPIPPDERGGFEGLSYYDPDPGYRVEATVELVDEGDTFEMEMTAGQPREYERVARLRFELDGDERALFAYRQAGAEGDSLFVPFRDESSGEETYGAGRYMELDVEGDLEDGAAVPLDFNLAYFPFCAYNEAFACPVTPRENTLATRVEAGERF